LRSSAALAPSTKLFGCCDTGRVEVEWPLDSHGDRVVRQANSRAFINYRLESSAA